MPAPPHSRQHTQTIAHTVVSSLRYHLKHSVLPGHTPKVSHRQWGASRTEKHSQDINQHLLGNPVFHIQYFHYIPVDRKTNRIKRSICSNALIHIKNTHLFWGFVFFCFQNKFTPTKFHLLQRDLY